MHADRHQLVGVVSALVMPRFSSVKSVVRNFFQFGSGTAYDAGIIVTFENFFLHFIRYSTYRVLRKGNVFVFASYFKKYLLGILLGFHLTVAKPGTDVVSIPFDEFLLTVIAYGHMCGLFNNTYA